MSLPSPAIVTTTSTTAGAACHRARRDQLQDMAELDAAAIHSDGAPPNTNTTGRSPSHEAQKNEAKKETGHEKASSALAAVPSPMKTGVASSLKMVSSPSDDIDDDSGDTMKQNVAFAKHPIVSPFFDCGATDSGAAPPRSDKLDRVAAAFAATQQKKSCDDETAGGGFPTQFTRASGRPVILISPFVARRQRSNSCPARMNAERESVLAADCGTDEQRTDAVAEAVERSMTPVFTGFTTAAGRMLFVDPEAVDRRRFEFPAASAPSSPTVRHAQAMLATACYPAAAYLPDHDHMGITGDDGETDYTNKRHRAEPDDFPA